MENKQNTSSNNMPTFEIGLIDTLRVSTKD